MYAAIYFKHCVLIFSVIKNVLGELMTRSLNIFFTVIKDPNLLKILRRSP